MGDRRKKERESKKKKSKTKVVKIQKKIKQKEETKIEIKNDEKIEEEILSKEEKARRRAIMDKLLTHMANRTLIRIDRMENAFSHGIGGADIYNFEWVKTNFINLVVELTSSHQMPALVFCLDRVQCEELYLKLLSDLEYLQEKKQQQDIGKGNSREMEIEIRRRQKKLE